MINFYGESQVMKTYAFKKADAFATATSSGNPAGIISLNTQDDISEHDMQRIARELKGSVSEVGYIWKNEDDTYGLRYFSSEREVEFCGHATIAIMYDLIKNNNELMTKETVSIVTNKGRLEVENRIAKENAVFITAPDPVFVPNAINKDEFAEAIKIEPSEISDTYPLSIVNAGLETLIVPLRSLNAVLSLSPQLDELRAYCQKKSIDIITIFTDQPAQKTSRFRTRVFAPTFGYLEDPATGSGNAAFGYYLLKIGKWDGKPMILEQNGDRANPNIVKLITKKAENGAVRVLFGGSAIVRIQGKYLLP
jgi:PhzF family phenazine biosynthesis protein